MLAQKTLKSRWEAWKDNELNYKNHKRYNLLLQPIESKPKKIFQFARIHTF